MRRSTERSNRQLQKTSWKLPYGVSSTFRYRTENNTIQSSNGTHTRKLGVLLRTEPHKPWHIRESHAAGNCHETTLNAFKLAADQTIEIVKTKGA